MPGAFISYTRADKAIARRVAWRLKAHGLEVWMDEPELRPGDVLDDEIRGQFRGADALVVIATAAAVNADWVVREVAWAREAPEPRRVCPLFVEDVKKHPLLQASLGIEATDPHHFEEALDRLVGIFPGTLLSAPAPETLRAALAELKDEEPALALLIDGCLEGQGLWGPHIERVSAAPFHDLDQALNATYDLAQGAQVGRTAHAAAAMFRRSGAGTHVLERHVAKFGGSDFVLNGAVARKLAPPEFNAAIGLLAGCNPPDDQSLAGFIHENSAALNPVQVGRAVRLVLNPIRPPTGFTVEAAFAALRAFPDSADLQWMLQLWIRDGQFDEGGGAKDLAGFLADSRSRALPGWETITAELRLHVRSLARSKDRVKVDRAVSHLRAAADARSLLWEEIAHECSAATGSAEWDKWSDATEMRIYVDAFVGESRRRRNWPEAWKSFEERWAAVKEFNEARTRLGLPVR